VNGSQVPTLMRPVIVRRRPPPSAVPSRIAWLKKRCSGSSRSLISDRW
jgi:hypothetical protein